MFRGTASDEISDKPEKNIKKMEKAGPAISHVRYV